MIGTHFIIWNNIVAIKRWYRHSRLSRIKIIAHGLERNRARSLESLCMYVHTIYVGFGAVSLTDEKEFSLRVSHRLEGTETVRDRRFNQIHKLFLCHEIVTNE